MKLTYLTLSFLLLSMSHSLKVAIVGGGYAGLSTAIKFIEKSCKVTLINRVSSHHPNGASAASSGLLHALTPKGKPIWKGLEGYQATMNIVNMLEESYPDTKIIQKSGSCILRPIYQNEDTYDDWMKALQSTPHLVQNIPKEEYYTMSEGKELINSIGAIAYKQSAIIDTSAYLCAMTRYLDDSGLCSHHTTAIHFNDIVTLSNDFDIVILALGAGIKHIWPTSTTIPSLRLSYAGGQNMVIPNHNKLTNAILKGEYIVPIQNNGRDMLLCGSTKEFLKDFEYDIFPSNRTKCESLLRPKLRPLLPSIDNVSTEFIESYPRGIRVITRRTGVGRLPIVDRFPLQSSSSSSSSDSSVTTQRKNVWFITGFGSRGLIHHGLIAEWICSATIHNDDTYIPNELKLSIAMKI